MSHPLLTQYRITDNGIVHANHQRLAEIINEYNPALSLAWIPAADRAEGEKPFCVVHTQGNGDRYPVMYLDENQLDHRVIAELYMRDASRMGKGELAAWAQAQDLAREALLAKQREDEKAERAEIAQTILKSKKHTYKHNGKVYT